MKDHPYDLIHCYNRPTVPLVAALLRRVPCRIFSKLSMSSYYEQNTQPVDLQKLYIGQRLACFSSHRVFAISPPVADEVVAICPFADKKVTVVGTGVDIDKFSSGNPRQILDELSLASDNIVIVSVGHAVPVKGWDILIRAFSKFNSLIPESTLVLIGSCDSDAEKETFSSLMSLVERCNLAQYLRQN